MAITLGELSSDKNIRFQIEYGLDDGTDRVYVSGQLQLVVDRMVASVRDFDLLEPETETLLEAVETWVNAHLAAVTGTPVEQYGRIEQKWDEVVPDITS